MPHLIIPVEERVRELDAKLLLAVIAAKRGFSVVFGRRDLIEHEAGRQRPGIFLGMDLRTSGTFRAAAQVGHRVVAWDEEAIVHYPESIYNLRRVSPDALSYIGDLFAWGNDNYELWNRNPVIRNQAHIWLTGNPRGDMLRPEFRVVYAPAAEELRRRFGDFILINTNFGSINNINPSLNLFVTNKKGDLSQGKGSSNMPLAYAKGLEAYRTRLYTSFRSMIKAVTAALPGTQFVVRPHPMENWDTYRSLAKSRTNLTVLHEGSVLPWLMAARAVVHNGCQTGLETRLLGGVPIAYRPFRDQDYDSDLPNMVSHSVIDVPELVDALQAALAGHTPAALVEADASLLDHFITARTGPLAAERVVDVLEKIAASPESLTPIDRAIGRVRALFRARGQRQRLNRPEIRQTFEHRFGAVTPAQLAERAERLCAAAGLGTPPRIMPLARNLFTIAADGSGGQSNVSVQVLTPTHPPPGLASAFDGLTKSPLKPLRLSGVRGAVADAAPFLVKSFPTPMAFSADRGGSQLASELRGPHAVYVVPKGYISQGGLVCDQAGRVLHGASHKYISDRKYRQGLLRSDKKGGCWGSILEPVLSVDDRVCALTASNQDYYYHWLIEVIGRLVALRLYAPEVEPTRLFVSTAARFQRETLELMGIDPARILPAQGVSLLGAREIVAPSYQVMRNQAFSQEIIGGIVSELTRSLEPPPSACRRLYLSRAGAAHRKVLNEAAVEVALRKHGFESVALEDYSLSQQIALMQSAEAIVAPHGGGLTNVIFCRPETVVVELMSEPIDLYQRLAKAAGISSYKAVVGQISAKKKAGTKLATSSRPAYKISKADFVVKVEAVLDALDMALKKPTPVSSDVHDTPDI